MLISVRVENLEAVQASITGRVKQVRFATAKALRDTALAVKDAIPGALRQQLDRPTEFTQRGTYVKPFKPDRDVLMAEVGLQRIQAGYLQYQVLGGSRRPTKKALRLPANVPLDSSGNLPPRTIAKLIQAAQQGKFGKDVKQRLGLDAAGKQGRRKRNAPAGPSLFYGQPRGLKWPVGIYRRVPGRPGKLIPIIVFPARQAQYKRRFDFYGLADQTVRTEWPRKIEAALQFALATAR